MKNNKKYVSAKIAFITKIKFYDFITPFIKKLRGKYKIWSSNIYHMDPLEIRRLKIERSFRDKNSAYTFTNPLYRYSESERLQGNPVPLDLFPVHVHAFFVNAAVF